MTTPTYNFGNQVTIHRSDLPYTLPSTFNPVDNCIVCTGGGQAGFASSDGFTSARGGDGSDCAIKYGVLLTPGAILAATIGSGGVNNGQAGGDSFVTDATGRRVVQSRGGGSLGINIGDVIFAGGKGSTNDYRFDIVARMILPSDPTTRPGGGAGGGSASMFGPGGKGSDTTAGYGGAWGCAGGGTTTTGQDFSPDAPGKAWLDNGGDPLFIGCGGNASKALMDLNHWWNRINFAGNVVLDNPIPGQGGTPGLLGGGDEIFSWPYMLSPWKPADAGLANSRGTGGLSANAWGGGGSGAPGGNFTGYSHPIVGFDATPDTGGYFVTGGIHGNMVIAGAGALGGGGGGGAGGYMYGATGANSPVTPPNWAASGSPVNPAMPNTDFFNAGNTANKTNMLKVVLGFASYAATAEPVPPSFGGAENSGGDGSITIMWNTFNEILIPPWQRLGFRIVPYPGEELG